VIVNHVIEAVCHALDILVGVVGICVGRATRIDRISAVLTDQPVQVNQLMRYRPASCVTMLHQCIPNSFLLE